MPPRLSLRAKPSAKSNPIRITPTAKIPTRAAAPIKLAAVSARPPPRFPRTLSPGTLTPSSANCGKRCARCPTESIARSKTRPGVGHSTSIIEVPRSAGASGSVRQSTDRRSAPLRSQPVAEEIQLLRPWMIHLSPDNLAVVRTPSPGGGVHRVKLLDHDRGSGQTRALSPGGKRNAFPQKSGRNHCLISGLRCGKPFLRGGQGLCLDRRGKHFLCELAGSQL